MGPLASHPRCPCAHAAPRIREMRNLLIVVAVLAAISFTPSPSNASVLGLFGFDCSGEHNCGCGCGSHCNCGNCCEPACGCGSGECCEPACGCGSGCYANGRQYAGQKFDCCCQSHAPICPCVNRGGCQGGCGCGTSCGCGDCCEPACGCGSCGEPCCAPCQPRKCCLKNCGFDSCCGHLINALCCGRSSCGCSGEKYWSEWHNDPPYCNDPCNCQGEWIGPSGGPNCGPCNGGCGCDGGCVGAQNYPVNNGPAYAKQGAVHRTQVANNSRPQQSNNKMRSAYTTQKQYQPANVRAASRPTTNRLPSPNSNSGTQAQPILW